MEPITNSLIFDSKFCYCRKWDNYSAMTVNKLATLVGIAVLAVAIITDLTPIYASPTTEDDGYTYPDDATEEEIDEIDEQEQEAWEDAGRPGEIEDDDDDGNENDDNNNEDNPPYCDEVDDDYSGSCFDRYDNDDITGLYPCKDGSQVSDPQLCESTAVSEISLNELGGTASCLYDTSLPECAPANGKCRDGYGMNEDGRCFPEHSKCPDGYHGHEDDESGECIPNSIPCSQGYIMTVMANGGDNCEQRPQKQISCVDVPFYMTCDNQKKTNDNDKTKFAEKTTVIQNSIATETTNAADISNCKLDGSADGIQQKFDIAKYQTCKLHTNNDRIYYDGFITGCMNVGNTKLICETVADSSILNIKTQPITLGES